MKSSLKGRDSQKCSVRFCYERAAPPKRSVLEHFGRFVEFVAKNSPDGVSKWPFANTARMSGGLLDTTSMLFPGTESWNLPSPKRLRCIEYNRVPLVENAYNAEGRLIRTDYCDHEPVHYLWDESSRKLRITSKSGGNTELQTRPDGLIESISYRGHYRFRYEYDASGRLKQLLFPDGNILLYVHDKYGRLVKSSSATMHFHYEWADSGLLRQHTFEADGAKLSFVNNSAKAHYKSSAIKSSACSGGRTYASGFGSWDFDSQNRLVGMFTPDGNQLGASFDKTSGDLTNTSSRSGRHEFFYSRQGRVASFVSPNGLRTMFHPLDGTRLGLLVGPDAVRFVETEERGRVKRLLDMSGAFVSFKYRRDESFFTVRNPTMTAQIDLSNSPANCSVKASGGFWITIAHSPATSQLEINSRPISPVLTTEMVWRWLVIKPETTFQI